MKYILTIFILFSFNIYSSELIGLDSLQFGNKIKILTLTENDSTKNIDTSTTYLKIYKNKNTLKPDLSIFNTDYQEHIRIISQDTSYFYFIDTNVFNKRKTSEFYTNSEIGIFYAFIYLKKNMFNSFYDFSKHIKLTTISEILPDSNLILHNIELQNIESNSKSKIKLTINTDDFSKLEYFDDMLEGPNDYSISKKHYIFYNIPEQLPIFDKMDSLYYFNRKNYEFKVQTKRKRISNTNVKIGDTLNINSPFVGVNSDDFDIKEYFKNNDFLFIYTWGSWCEPCMLNSENVGNFNKEIKKGNLVTLISELHSKTIPQLKKIVKIKNIDYPVFSNDKFIMDNGLTTFPAMLKINKEGIVLGVIEGKVYDYTEYMELLDK